MSKATRWVEDPVVAEVRSIRAELWREAGGTVSGLIRLIEKRRPTKREHNPARSKRMGRRA